MLSRRQRDSLKEELVEKNRLALFYVHSLSLGHDPRRELCVIVDISKDQQVTLLEQVRAALTTIIEALLLLTPPFENYHYYQNIFYKGLLRQIYRFTGSLTWFTHSSTWLNTLLYFHLTSSTISAVEQTRSDMKLTYNSLDSKRYPYGFGMDSTAGLKKKGFAIQSVV